MAKGQAAVELAASSRMKRESRDMMSWLFVLGRGTRRLCSKLLAGKNGFSRSLIMRCNDRKTRKGS